MKKEGTLSVLSNYIYMIDIIHIIFHNGILVEIEHIKVLLTSVHVYEGTEYEVDFVPKLKAEIVLNDDQIATVIAVILDVVNTGSIGDGKNFVLLVETVCRIRTGERDNNSI